MGSAIEEHAKDGVIQQLEATEGYWKLSDGESGTESPEVSGGTPVAFADLIRNSWRTLKVELDERLRRGGEEVAQRDRERQRERANHRKGAMKKCVRVDASVMYSRIRREEWP